MMVGPGVEGFGVRGDDDVLVLRDIPWLALGTDHLCYLEEHGESQRLIDAALVDIAVHQSRIVHG
jgi:hypothetical protein